MFSLTQTWNILWFFRLIEYYFRIKNTPKIPFNILLVNRTGDRYVSASCHTCSTSGAVVWERPYVVSLFSWMPPLENWIKLFPTDLFWLNVWALQYEVASHCPRSNIKIRGCKTVSQNVETFTTTVYNQFT